MIREKGDTFNKNVKRKGNERDIWMGEEEAGKNKV